MIFPVFRLFVYVSFRNDLYLPYLCASILSDPIAWYGTRSTGSHDSAPLPGVHQDWGVLGPSCCRGDAFPFPPGWPAIRTFFRASLLARQGNKTYRMSGRPVHIFFFLFSGRNRDGLGPVNCQRVPLRHDSCIFFVIVFCFCFFYVLHFGVNWSRHVSGLPKYANLKDVLWQIFVLGSSPGFAWDSGRTPRKAMIHKRDCIPPLSARYRLNKHIFVARQSPPPPPHFVLYKYRWPKNWGVLRSARKT